jgi:beta-phosphoglucomutase-like phosphatase (HAD superfamily)
MSLKAVLFDLDGVIVDTAKYHYIAWKALADRLGIYFDEGINERLKGVSRMASLDIILERSETDYSDAKKEALATEKNDRYVSMVRTS